MAARADDGASEAAAARPVERARKRLGGPQQGLLGALKPPPEAGGAAAASAADAARGRRKRVKREHQDPAVALPPGRAPAAPDPGAVASAAAQERPPPVVGVGRPPGGAACPARARQRLAAQPRGHGAAGRRLSGSAQGLDRSCAAPPWPRCCRPAWARMMWAWAWARTVPGRVSELPRIWVCLYRSRCTQCHFRLHVHSVLSLHKQSACCEVARDPSVVRARDPKLQTGL